MKNVYISSRVKKQSGLPPHIWNNSGDVNQFIEALKDIM